MKKYLISIFIVPVLLSCGASPGKNDEGEVKDITQHPDYKKGLELVSKDNCFTCHKIEGKLIGPAYKDIAGKYDNNGNVIEDLSAKIRKGTVGVWGNVPMPARADIPEEKAKAMVRYILLLKK